MAKTSEELFTEVYERMGQRGLADAQAKLEAYRRQLFSELGQKLTDLGVPDEYISKAGLTPGAVEVEVVADVTPPTPPAG